MARKVTPRNGESRLEEAMALLIQNQAAFLSNQAAFLSCIADTGKELAELRRDNSERFARIEKDMTAILHVRAEHSRILERLPEAVRDKIGFKA